MYIFQEMIDTERDYVKSLEYIMDVSKHFSSVSLGVSGLSYLLRVFYFLYVFLFFVL